MEIFIIITFFHPFLSVLEEDIKKLFVKILVSLDVCVPRGFLEDNSDDSMCTGSKVLLFLVVLLFPPAKVMFVVCQDLCYNG